MNQNLHCVSLTGADDATSLDDLNTLGLEFPFVEWALLYVPGNEGQPRNPSKAWREAFFANRPMGSNAVHLCGARAFQEIIVGVLPEEILEADRLQLNINARRPEFSNDQVVDIYRRALQLGPTLILQRHEFTAVAIDNFLRGSLNPADRARVTVLCDESRGKGITPESWSVPWDMEGITIGFAGGINPENASETLVALEPLDVRYWIDMESGLRTDNAFDLAKARAVLAAAAPFAAQRSERAGQAQSLPS